MPELDLGIDELCVFLRVPSQERIQASRTSLTFSCDIDRAVSRERRTFTAHLASRIGESADGSPMRDFIHTGGAKLRRPGLDR